MNRDLSHWYINPSGELCRKIDYIYDDTTRRIEVYRWDGMNTLFRCVVTLIEITWHE